MKRITCFIIWAVLPFHGIAQQPDKRGVILSSATASVTANTYAVVIGISKYKEVTPLKFADRDAQKFADWLLSKTGAALDSAKVKLFLNEQATINNIGNALSDIMLGNIKKNDRIIFFFAGHGDYDANILKDQALLLLYGAPKQNYFQNIFSGDFISTADLNSRFVEPLAAKGCELMLILDACHATGLNKSLSGGAEGGKITSMALQNMTSPVKLYSCQASEYSLESDQWGGGRGLFSYILMEGLYGLADADHDKTVTLRELQRYLEDNVPKLAAPNKQNPVVKLEDATQAVSKVNDAFLASYVSEKNKGLIFIAQADPKGSNDRLLETMDSIQKKLYHDCDSLTAAMQLDDAYKIFLLFAKNDSSSSVSLQLRRNLSAALQGRTASILNPMFDDVTNFRSKADDVERAGKDLDKAMSLLGETHFLYKNLQARALFLKAVLISLKRFKSSRKEAIGYLHQSVLLEPNAPYSYFYLGRFYSLNSTFYPYDTTGVFHNLDSALFYFKKYVGLIPKSIYGIANLAAVYRSLQNIDEAVNQLRKGLVMFPNSPLLNFKLAIMLYQQKKFDEALIYSRRAIDFSDCTLDSSSREFCSSVYNHLGLVYKNLGRRDDCIASYKRSMELDPDNGQVIQNTAFFYCEDNDYRQALYYFIKLADHYQKYYPEAYYYVGWAYTTLKEYDGAFKYYDTALSYKVFTGSVYFDKSVIYAQKNLPDSALRYLELFLQHKDDMVDWAQKGPADLESDERLDPIRALPAFRIILEKYFTKEELEKYVKMYLKK